ncbi:MAG: hypothetical protein ABR986_09935 [Methanomassiliicoccales archaeon]|jgi:hypothetical protein
MNYLRDNINRVLVFISGLMQINGAAQWTSWIVKKIATGTTLLHVEQMGRCPCR